MHHQGTKRTQPRRVHGYPWFDWDTGKVDRRVLAEHLIGKPQVGTPQWALDMELPDVIENARPTDLAKVDARAHRAWQES